MRRYRIREFSPLWWITRMLAAAGIIVGIYCSTLMFCLVGYMMGA